MKKIATATLLLIIFLSLSGFKQNDFFNNPGREGKRVSSERSGIPYYFLAIHNEPSHGNMLVSQYKILQRYINAANKYNIKLTLMFTAPWIEYILSSQERTREVKRWQEQGHEISSHHHEYYHSSFDGYSRYSEADVKAKRDGAGANQMRYLGTIEDYSRIILSFDPGIKSGCSNEEHDKSTMPDFVVYSTCSGFSNNGSPQRQLHDVTREKAINDYILVGQVNGIERKWLSHFMFFKDLKVSKETFRSMNDRQVFGGVVHSTNHSDQDKAAIQFIEFLGQLDPSGEKSKTVSEVIEEGLLPEKKVSQEQLQRSANNSGLKLLMNKNAKGRCGDNICDDLEKANPYLCPKDCR